MKNIPIKKYTLSINLLISITLLQITAKSQSYNLEQIHTHVNKNIYIAGEAVWYKIYCLNSKTKKLSDISNVAYIQLINQDGNPINQQSIILKNGMGSGGFELSENLPTGNYAINAYTHWMKSISINLVNVTQIFIYNSNRNQEKSSSDSLTQTNKPLIMKDICVENNREKSTDTIKTKTRKQIKIPLKLSDFTNQTDTLYLSASIKLREPENINHSNNIKNSYINLDSTLKTKYNVTPQKYAENKSYILEGKLIQKESKHPVSNSLIYLSKIGAHADIDPYITKKDGSFFFKMPLKRGVHDIAIKYENAGNKELRVELKEKFNKNVIAPEKWNKKYLNKENLNHIKKIWENYNIRKMYKQKTFNKHKHTTPFKSQYNFFGTPQTSIKIKNYVRLDSLEEYFHELIPAVKIKYQNNKTIVKIYNPDQNILMKNPPLLLFDGIIIDDYSEILAKKIEQIQQIDVVPFQYLYRSAQFYGIIHVISKNKKCELSSLPKNTERYYLEPFTKKINFIKQDKLSTKKNIPDFRTDLLWKPEIEIHKNKNSEINFYTGDIKEQYELIIQGISAKGKPIYHNKKIIIQ